MMFEIGKIVFSKTFGWMEVIEVNTVGFWAKSVSDTNLHCFWNDGRYEKSELFLDVFESPGAMIEYFKNNAPPKPKKMVKKTVEGWARKATSSPAMIFSQFTDDLTKGMPEDIKICNATLTFEIEE
jgi:hypothetical protein